MVAPVHSPPVRAREGGWPSTVHAPSPDFAPVGLRSPRIRPVGAARRARDPMQRVQPAHVYPEPVSSSRSRPVTMAVGPVTMAVFEDTCGNLMAITSQNS